MKLEPKLDADDESDDYFLSTGESSLIINLAIRLKTILGEKLTNTSLNVSYILQLAKHQ